MKLVAFNGSPRPGGNTQQLVDLVLAEVAKEGIETERVDICKERPRGCIGCWKCAENQDERCILTDDPMNEWIQKAKAADGIIIASPTYFSNVTAETKALLDRMGAVTLANGMMLRRKVAAAIIAVRRAGAVCAFDAINHMFQIGEMVVIGSTYWNMGIGLNPGDIQTDEEGLKNMRNLADNMVWAMKKLNA